MKPFFNNKKRSFRNKLYKKQLVQNNICKECNGVGLIKYEDIIINDIRYKPCSPEGFIRMPYDECDKCYGSGIITA